MTACCNGEATYEAVKTYYGQVLTTSKDLKTSACTSGSVPSPTLKKVLARVPDEVLAKFYGCGAPLPLGIQGLNVLDLGSGSGRDAYACAALVGEAGSVTGVDMTDEQNEVARRHAHAYCTSLGFPQTNMNFITGHIEFLDRAGIADESMDLVISNCVVNLSPDKPRVIKEAYRVLRPGGELYFSDVYCDRRLSEAVQKDEVLWGECISGALYIGDFKRLAAAAGFVDQRVLHAGEITVQDEAMRALLGCARFYSITYRLFKVPGLLETECEDYGQVATYKGTIEGHGTSYELDQGHVFEKGKPMLVCGNTAAMVGENGLSWLAPHFEVTGDRGMHYGKFASCGSSGGGNAALGFAVLESKPSAAAGSCC